MAAAYRRRIPVPHFQPTAATHCLSPTAAAAAAPVKPSSPSAAERVEAPLSTLRPGFTSDSHFKYSRHRKLGWSVGAVMIGQAAFFLGLSNGYAFAQEDSVSLAATSEKAEVDATGLQRIEDGSVVSNEHTVKWRIFTDNGRDFFQKRQLDKAEKLFQAALLEAKEGFGLRDPHVASALNNLAEFYRLKQEYEKAELLYLEAIEILEESFGSDDIRVGTALHSLGMCYHLQLKFSQAQTCYERVDNCPFPANLYLPFQLFALTLSNSSAVLSDGLFFLVIIVIPPQARRNPVLCPEGRIALAPPPSFTQPCLILGCRHAEPPPGAQRRHAPTSACPSTPARPPAADPPLDPTSRQTGLLVDSNGYPTGVRLRVHLLRQQQGN